MDNRRFVALCLGTEVYLIDVNRPKEYWRTTHEANQVINRIKLSKPESVLVYSHDVLEYGLFEGLEADGVSVSRLCSNSQICDGQYSREVSAIKIHLPAITAGLIRDSVVHQRAFYLPPIVQFFNAFPMFIDVSKLLELLGSLCGTQSNENLMKENSQALAQLSDRLILPDMQNEILSLLTQITMDALSEENGEFKDLNIASRLCKYSQYSLNGIDLVRLILVEVERLAEKEHLVDIGRFKRHAESRPLPSRSLRDVLITWLYRVIPIKMTSK